MDIRYSFLSTHREIRAREAVNPYKLQGIVPPAYAASLHPKRRQRLLPSQAIKSLETMSDTFEDLKLRLRQFAVDRDWEQFHSPKNMAMALIGEAGELVEHFQWLTEQQSYELPPGKLDEVRLEMADILIYLIRLSDRLGVDLLAAVEDKIAINERKYPVDRVRGSSKKYTEY